MGQVATLVSHEDTRSRWCLNTGARQHRARGVFWCYFAFKLPRQALLLHSRCLARPGYPHQGPPPSPQTYMDKSHKPDMAAEVEEPMRSKSDIGKPSMVRAGLKDAPAVRAQL